MVADFRQFQEYCKKYSQMATEFQAWFTDWLYEMAQRTIARTKLRTPWRTGALRNAWTIGGIKRSGNNFEIELINNMEYASEVEYGHKGVFVPALGVTMFTDTKRTNGVFMLTISMNEIVEQMPKRFDQAFRQFLRQNGLE